MKKLFSIVFIITLSLACKAQDHIFKIPVQMELDGQTYGARKVSVVGEQVYYACDFNDSLYMYSNGDYFSYALNTGEESLRFKFLKALDDGRVCIKTYDDLYLFQDGVCTEIELPEQEARYGWTPNISGSHIYITSDSAFHIYDGNTWQYISLAHFNRRFTSAMILLESDTSAWIYRVEDGLYRYENGEVSLYDSTGGRNVMCYDDQKQIWTYGFQDGNRMAGIYDNGEFVPFAEIYPGFDLNVPIKFLYSNENGLLVFETNYDRFLVTKDSIHVFDDIGYYAAEGFHDNYFWSFNYDTIYRYDLTYRNSIDLAHDGRFHFYNYKKLDINNISAGYNTWGELNPSTWEADLIYSVTWPKDSTWVINHNRGLIMGARDANDSIHVNNEKRYQSRFSYQPGPLDTVTCKSNLQIASKYDRIFSIERVEIEEFIYMYEKGFVNDSSYSIPRNILEWPAQGEGNVSRKLAPFIDVDNDGIYNPYNGDYPKMKGDEMFWYVFTDNFTEYRTCPDRPFGIEVHTSVYAYNLNEEYPDSMDVINNCHFVEYEIFNRSDTTYYDTYLGIFDHGSLPDYQQHYNNSYVYSGCNVDLNASYFYNYPLDDDSTEILFKTVSWLTFLEGPLADSDDDIDNDHDFEIDEVGETINMSSFIPSSCCPPWPYPSCSHYRGEDVYNMLQGNRFNGEPFNYFDDYQYPEDTTSGVACKYVFPGNSNPNGWGQDGAVMPEWTDSEYSWGLGPRITYSGIGPFTFEPGQQVSLKFVYGASINNQLGLEGSDFENDIRNVRQLYFNNLLEDHLEYFPDDTLVDIGLDVKLYPNPVARDFIRVDLYNETNEPVAYELFDLQGRKLKEGVLEFNYRNMIVVKELIEGLYFIRFFNSQLSVTKQLIRVE